MKKEELIEELKKEIEATKNVLNCEEHFSLYAKGKRVGLEFGWMFAEKLDEPELPVIPQFVADHIEVRKKVGKRLNVALSESPEAIMSEKMNIAIFEANNIYARAWLDGYTIEPEPMYLVKVNDQGSCLYLKSMQLYKDVESRTDLNSNFEAWKEKAIKFTNKEQAEGIAKFFNGEVVEVTE